MNTLTNQTWGDVQVGDVLYCPYAMNPRRRKVTRIDRAQMRGYLVIQVEEDGHKTTPIGGHKLGGELTLERS